MEWSAQQSVDVRYAALSDPPDGLPKAFVFRRGRWEPAAARDDITQVERHGIDNPAGNGDTPTAHKVLPIECWEANVVWAENVIASASSLPQVSTLFAGFSIANLFGIHHDTFSSHVLVNVFLSCQGTTIALNLYIAVAVSTLCMKATRQIASDRRVLIDRSRYGKGNVVFIGKHGENVAPCHGIMANHHHIIDNSMKMFMWSIVSYLVAIFAWAIDQLEYQSTLLVVTPVAMSGLYLFVTLFQFGHSLI